MLEFIPHGGCGNTHQSGPTHLAGSCDLLGLSGGLPTDTVKDFALSEIGRLGCLPGGCQPDSEGRAVCSPGPGRVRQTAQDPARSKKKNSTSTLQMVA